MAMHVLLVLEDKNEAKALGEVATQFGMTCRLCDSFIEGEALLKKQPWRAIVVRRGKGAIALRSFLRAAIANAPTAKVFVLGAATSTGPDEALLREVAAGGAVEILGDAPRTEILNRLCGARPGQEPAILGYETLRAIDDRKSWSLSLARERTSSQLGVLAVLHPRLGLSLEALEKLSQTIAPALALKHSGLGTARKVALEPPSPFIFWSTPRGLPLTQLVDVARAETSSKPLPIAGVIGVMTQVAGALRALHEAGAHHGAVEAWAVWLSEEGNALLMHQGFATYAEGHRRKARDSRATMQQTDDGVAPERLVDEASDAIASDLWSMGVLLYELLCGVRPFRRKTAAETLQAIVRDTPTPPAALRPDTPAALSELTLSLLAKVPTDRPKGAALIEEALLSMLPKMVGWRGLLGAPAKPETLVATMIRERSEEILLSDQ